MTNTHILIKMREASELRIFALDAEVADIGPRDAIIGLSWLVRNEISIDTVKHLLRHPEFTTQCRHCLIPIVSVLQEDPVSVLEEDHRSILKENPIDKSHVNDATLNQTNNDSTDILLIVDIKDKHASYAQIFSRASIKLT